MISVKNILYVSPYGMTRNSSELLFQTCYF